MDNFNTPLKGTPEERRLLSLKKQKGRQIDQCFRDGIINEKVHNLTILAIAKATTEDEVIAATWNKLAA